MGKKAIKDEMRRTLFIPITRVEEIDEETCRVIGVGTSDDVDSFDSVFDYDGSKLAYGRWSDAFERATGGESKGNIREMHQKSAAGKLVDWTPDDEKRAIELSTFIVGREPVRKCRERIYTGFSHGVKLNSPGRTEKRDGKSVTVYRDFDIIEVSLVDAPSNPSAVFTMVRRAEDGKTEILAPVDAATRTILEAQTGTREDAISKAADQIVATMAAEAQKAPSPAAPASPATPAPAPAAPARAADPDLTRTGGKKDPKLDSCVEKLKGEGHDESSAFAICHTSLGRIGEGASAEDLKREIDKELERLRVPRALVFRSDKLTPEKAQEWAAAHGFRARKPSAAVDGRFQIAQRSADSFIADKGLVPLPLAEGVELDVATLKADAPAARLLTRLRMASPALVRYAQSESGSILPALSALASLCYAIDSEIFSIPYDTNDPLATSDVASLTTAMEAILEFVGSELREQLSSLSTAGGEARVQASTALERFTRLPQVLRPAQMERLLQDGELKQSAGAMHGLGHDLVEATVKMTESCRCVRCAPTPAAPGPATTRAADPAIPMAAAPVGPAPAPALGPPPAAAAPATSLERSVSPPNGNEAIAQAIGKVAEQVTAAVKPLIDSVDARLRTIESSPTRVGRPPAAPVDKTLAGSPTMPLQGRAAVKAELERIANTSQDPSVQREMRMRLAELELLQPGAPS